MNVNADSIIQEKIRLEIWEDRRCILILQHKMFLVALSKNENKKSLHKPQKANICENN
jgi:hypothetical protein